MDPVFKAAATEHDLRIKNRMYDDASAPIWRLTVYDPVHGGWEFTNIGGKHVLDDVGARGGLGPGKSLLELCCGLGATCRYLRERFDCDITGVDMNPHQIAHAIESVADAPGERGADKAIDFVLADIVTWEPSRLYDAILIMDSLTMIEEPLAILRKSSLALRPDGLLGLAEVTAGKNIDNEVRRYCWEQDGFINLITASEYCDLLRRSGFGRVEAEDLNHLAVDCFRTIHRSVGIHEEAITESGGKALFDGWLELAEFYIACFEQDRLTYSYITGRCA